MLSLAFFSLLWSKNTTEFIWFKWVKQHEIIYDYLRSEIRMCLNKEVLVFENTSTCFN